MEKRMIRINPWPRRFRDMKNIAGACAEMCAGAAMFFVLEILPIISGGILFIAALVFADQFLGYRP